jgi:ABC-type enterochelin transport system permease subunit
MKEAEAVIMLCSVKLECYFSMAFLPICENQKFQFSLTTSSVVVVVVVAANVAFPNTP